MLRILKTRLGCGYRTASLPRPGEWPLAEGFRGLLRLPDGPCPQGCGECARACPTGAITVAEDAPRIDLGRCLFCPECAAACPRGAISCTREHRLAATAREGLVLGPGCPPPEVARIAPALRRIFGRSFKLRQVSAGGCTGCEGELLVTGTVVFDLARFGVQFMASPRHADALVVTGPVTANMRLALEKSHAALPPPRLVIACGACAISGGPFRGSPDCHDGLGGVLPVDLWLPGCPPHPWTVADGILRLLGRR